MMVHKIRFLFEPVRQLNQISYRFLLVYLHYLIMVETPNLEKNYSRYQETTREKIFNMWKIITTTLSEIIFSHPNPKYIILRNIP